MCNKGEERVLDPVVRAQVRSGKREVPESIARRPQCELVYCARRCVCVYASSFSTLLVLFGSDIYQNSYVIIY